MADSVILWQVLSLFILLVFYHLAEYFIHKRLHPNRTDLGSFLITPEYLAAFSLGYAEYAIERYFFPFKSNPHSPLIWVGAVAMLFGLWMRFAAILTAGKAFTHRVENHRRKHHNLVTHGIYHYVRHPGYLGFYIFALGTQTMLQNPISIVVFTVVLWRFFKKRVVHEEKSLIGMFGRDYEIYRAKTRTWIPFIP
jgi:protein-S-isoprenylcysteine O-methyltransferase